MRHHVLNVRGRISGRLEAFKERLPVDSEVCLVIEVPPPLMKSIIETGGDSRLWQEKEKMMDEVRWMR